MVECCYHYLETIRSIKFHFINISIIMQDQGHIYKVETVSLRGRAKIFGAYRNRS